MTATLGAVSRWQLCWGINPGPGLTLTNADFGTGTAAYKPILVSAALAQMVVTYDDGDASKVALDLPGYSYLTANITAADCPGGQVMKDAAGDPVLCAIVRTDGLRYDWSDSDFDTGNHTHTGVCLDIYTVTPVDWYTYLNKWTFCDDGSIEPQISASGQLAPSYTGNATNSSAVGPGDTDYRLDHFHNAFWRIEFALSKTGAHPQIAEQNATRTGSAWTTTTTPYSKETESSSAANRSWMAMSTTLTNPDKHPLSYEIDANNPDPDRGLPGFGYLDHDIYVTQYDKCEVLAASKPGGQQCGAADGSSVNRYVNGQALTRPILWVQESFHHVPRDEDQTIMDLHWLGFTMMPMGLNSENPLAPQ